MKRVDRWMIGIGLFITVGLMTVTPGHPASHEESTHAPDEHATTCTLNTLKGRYLFGGITTLLPPAVMEQSLLAVAGYHTFNGDGTGTDIVTVKGKASAPGPLQVPSALDDHQRVINIFLRV